MHASRVVVLSAIRAIVVGGILATGCYQSPAFTASCAITCSDTCPGGMTCDPELHVCVAPGESCDDLPPPPPDFVHPRFERVAAGTDFACGLDEDRALWCWGSNRDHQIDPGDRLVFPYARKVGTDAWDAIAVGGGHACGIRAGELACWGRNDMFQASGRAGEVTAPTAVQFTGQPSAPWTAVATGPRSTCAIAGGELYCWGYNKLGSLGTDQPADSAELPARVANMRTDFTAVSVGSTHTCAIAGGELYCFGRDDNGQSAGGTIQTPIVSAATNWTSVAVTETATCGTTADGTLWCFGAEGYGELGGDRPNNATAPIQASTLTGWTRVAGSHTMLCGLRDTDVYCWGLGRLGGLGKGRWFDNDQPFNLVTTGATDVSVGWSRWWLPSDPGVPGSEAIDEHELACAVVDHEIACWGDDRHAQLGNGFPTMAAMPLAMQGDPTFEAIALGDSHGCGLNAGVVSCWGSTVEGQATGTIAGVEGALCGPGIECDVAAPKPIVMNATAVATGKGHTCALHGSTISCWGSNRGGALGGSGASAMKREVPGTWATLFQVGRRGQCARPTTGGETWCWGDLEASAPPAHVPELDPFTQFAIGRRFECFLTDVGEPYCRGANGDGQYGAAIAASATPVKVRTYAYRAIAATGNDDHACGLTTGGTVECWGENARGQTGGDTDPTLAPHELPLSGCTAISVAAAPANPDDPSMVMPSTSCALCDGEIACWGDNRFAGLGTGTYDATPQRAPRLIAKRPLADDPWVALVGGGGFTCARSAAGHVYCWGFESHGGMGNGGLPANLPVVVKAVATP